MRILTLAVVVTACGGGGQSPPGDGALNDGVPGDGAFKCADDSALEPNDSLQTAFVVPPGSTTFAGLSICPQSDLDLYRIDVATANTTLEILTEAETDVPLSLSILNAGGSALANGVPGGTRMVRAAVPNLPVGSFFARVSSSAGQNNYKITVNLTP